MLYLSNVIRALGEVSKQGNKGKDKHINFRDSKLTRILQYSLSGNSKTSVICTINCQASNQS